MLRGDAAHAFVMQAHDMYTSGDSICMVMPKAVGTMEDLIEGKKELRLERGGKVSCLSVQFSVCSVLCLFSLLCTSFRACNNNYYYITFVRSDSCTSS
jgi:hypothetical protein